MTLSRPILSLGKLLVILTLVALIPVVIIQDNSAVFIAGYFTLVVIVPVLLLFARLQLRLHYALLLLILSATISRESMGLPVEADLPTVIFLFFWVIVSLRRKILQRRYFPLLLPVLLFLGTNLFTSVTFSLLPSASLRQTAILTLRALTFYLTIIAFLQHVSLRHKYVQFLQFILVINVLLALFVLTMSRLSITVIPAIFRLIQVRSEGAGGGLSIRGTFQESNVIAIYLLCVVSITMAMYVFQFPKRSPRGYRLLAVLGIGLAGILAAFTRSAWFGYVLIVGLLGTILLARSGRQARKSYIRIIIVSSILLMIVIAVVLLFAQNISPTSWFADLAFRLELTFESNSSVNGRLDRWVLALESWRNHFWFGNGLISFQVVSEVELNYITGWIFNWVVQALHDSGVMGLLFQSIFYCGCLYYAWKAYTLTDNLNDKGILLGYFLAQIALYFTSLFSMLTWAAIAWVLLGLSTAHSIHIIEQSRKKTA